jgi:hypothetical protein
MNTLLTSLCFRRWYTLFLCFIPSHHCKPKQVPSDSDLDDLFTHADLDQGGTVDEEEFVTLYTRAEAAVAKSG